LITFSVPALLPILATRTKINERKDGCVLARHDDSITQRRAVIKCFCAAFSKENLLEKNGSVFTVTELNDFW